MQSFRFRLQRVLEWRTRSADAERRKVAECLAAVTATGESIARLQAESVRVEYDVLSRTKLEAQDLAALERFRLRIKKQHATLQGLRERQKSALALQQQAFASARQKQKALEILKQRRSDEHTYSEYRELEELAAEAFLAQWKRG
jgi:hypothetical protein